MSASANTSAPTGVSIEVALFGAFRQYGSAPLRLTLPAGSTAAAAKAALAAQLTAAYPAAALGPLLAASVLADEHAVLDDTAPLTAGARLAILPPVCGG